MLGRPCPFRHAPGYTDQQFSTSIALTLYYLDSNVLYLSLFFILCHCFLYESTAGLFLMCSCPWSIIALVSQFVHIKLFPLFEHNKRLIVHSELSDANPVQQICEHPGLVYHASLNSCI